MIVDEKHVQKTRGEDTDISRIREKHAWDKASSRWYCIVQGRPVGVLDRHPQQNMSVWDWKDGSQDTKAYLMMQGGWQ